MEFKLKRLKIDSDPNRLEFSDKAIRFGCGTIFGLIASYYFFREYVFPRNSAFFGHHGVSWVEVLLSAVVCGYLALKFGDRFWNSFKD